MTYLEWLQLHLRYDAREQPEMRMLVVKISINLPHLTKRCNHLIATNAPVTEMRNPPASIFYLLCAFSNSRVHLSSGTYTHRYLTQISIKAKGRRQHNLHKKHQKVSHHLVLYLLRICMRSSLNGTHLSLSGVSKTMSEIICPYNVPVQRV